MEDKRYPLKSLAAWRDSVISFEDSQCGTGLLKSVYVKKIAENEEVPQHDDDPLKYLSYFEVYYTVRNYSQGVSINYGRGD